MVDAAAQESIKRVTRRGRASHNGECSTGESRESRIRSHLLWNETRPDFCGISKAFTAPLDVGTKARNLVANRIGRDSRAPPARRRSAPFLKITKMVKSICHAREQCKATAILLV